MFCYLPFRGPCKTSFPTSQSCPSGFFTITWQSGSFRRLVCSIPSSRLLLGSDSSTMCPHASEIGSGSAPPLFLIRTFWNSSHYDWRFVCIWEDVLRKRHRVPGAVFFRPLPRSRFKNACWELSSSFRLWWFPQVVSRVMRKFALVSGRNLLQGAA